MDTLNRRRGKRTQRGAAAVEFALLLPVMMLVIGGIVDLGRAFFVQIELTNSAREGARAALIGADGVARAEAAVSDQLKTQFTFSATVPACAAPDTEVEATTRVTDFEWIVLAPIMNIPPFSGGAALPTTLESTAVMRCS